MKKRWGYIQSFLVCEEESVFDAVSVVNVEVYVKDASKSWCEGMDRQHNVINIAKPNLEKNICFKEWKENSGEEDIYCKALGIGISPDLPCGRVPLGVMPTTKPVYRHIAHPEIALLVKITK